MDYFRTLKRENIGKESLAKKKMAKFYEYWPLNIDQNLSLILIEMIFIHRNENSMKTRQSISKN